MPLSAKLFEHARQRPDALAISLAGQDWCYRELAAQVAGLDLWAGTLPGHKRPGIALPDHARLIAVSLGNSAHAAPFLAMALSTAHAVMLMDPTWPEAQLAEMLEQVRPDALAALPSQTSLRRAATRLGIPLLNNLPAPAHHVPAQATPTDSFLVGFTSGTTSRPKGFARSRQSWRASLDAGRREFALDETGHTLAPGPLSHGVTLYALAETLDAGAAFHGLERFDAFHAAQLLKSGQVARLVAVPSMLAAVSGRGPFPALTNVTSAGAKLDPQALDNLFKTFPAAMLHEYYGASELGFVSVSHHRPGASSAAPDTVGHPFAHVELQLRRDGQPVTDTREGTIFVRGDLAIDGYLAEGHQTGFRKEGAWATVGDVGRLNPDGSLTLLGREGGMVVTAGYNVYPQEVETALLRVPGISSACVLPRADGARGKILVAVLETSGPLDLSALQDMLPRYKIPRTFYKVTSLPRTPSGKIASASLQRWLDQKDSRLAPLDPAS